MSCICLAPQLGQTARTLHEKDNALSTPQSGHLRRIKPRSGSPHAMRRSMVCFTNAGTVFPSASKDSTKRGHHSLTSGCRGPEEGVLGTYFGATCTRRAQGEGHLAG